MQKTSYSLLQIQVDKLYASPLSNKESIEDRCHLIESMIKSCGWGVDEYFYYIPEN
jgi:hypothetical protein